MNFHLHFKFYAQTRVIMTDLCPVCYAEKPTTSGDDVDVLPCCKNFICGDCMARWRNMSNHCPLCKAEMSPPEDVLRTSLADLARHLGSVSDCLQRISSVAEHVSANDERSTAVRPALNDIFDKAMKLGLFGSTPSVAAFNIEIPGDGIFGETISRDILSFMLAVGARSNSPDIPLDFGIDVPHRRDEHRGRGRAAHRNQEGSEHRDDEENRDDEGEDADWETENEL